MNLKSRSRWPTRAERAVLTVVLAMVTLLQPAGPPAHVASVARRGAGRVPPPPPGPAVAPRQPGLPDRAWPDASTTGVPAGTTLRPSGSLTVRRQAAVVSDLDVRGCLTIDADAVVVRRVRVRCGGEGYAVDVLPGHRGVLIEDVEIDGLGRPGMIAVGVAGYTLRRADVHGVGDGPRMGDRSTVEDSYIHDLAIGSGAHNDGIQSTGGRPLMIRHNRIVHRRAQTSCILLGADLGDIVDATVKDNLLDGGNYTVYAGSSGGHVARGVRIIGNRFGRGFVYGPASLGRSGITWSGNRWADSGRRIPR